MSLLTLLQATANFGPRREKQLDLDLKISRHTHSFAASIRRWNLRRKKLNLPKEY